MQTQAAQQWFDILNSQWWEGRPGVMSGGEDDLLKLRLSFVEPQGLSSSSARQQRQSAWVIRSAFGFGLRGRGGAGAPVRGVGPICTVTSSSVTCLQQEVELAQSGLGYCTPGRTHCMIVVGYRMSKSCWLIRKTWKCKFECVRVRARQNTAHRCIPFELCICLCAYFVCAPHALGIIMIHCL